MAEETPKRGGKRATPPGHVKVFKTAVFKIHNPSKRRRAVLLDSMKRAHLAYGKLLTRFMPDDEEIQRLKTFKTFDRRKELSALRLRVNKEARQAHLANNSADAIAQDVIDQISGTAGLQNEQEDVGLPGVARLNASQPEYEAALQGLMSSADLMSENDFRDELLQVTKSGSVRPLNFVRTRAAAGFLLLRDPNDGRLWAWLNLHPASSRFASTVAVPDPNEGRELINVKTGEFISFKSKVGERFALEMSRDYHEVDYLEQGEPQTARLYHRQERDEFELHITFQFVVPKQETTHWIGVDRGIYNLAALSVVDGDGNVLHQERVSGMDLRHVQRQIERRTAGLQKRGKVVRDKKRLAHANEAVHVAANAIVAAAKKHNARVVLEDLRNLGAVRRRTRIPGTRRSGFNVLLNRSQYEKLKQFLEYKLKLEGLPQPLFIRAAGTSQTCPECGHWSHKNRIKRQGHDGGFKMDAFKCVECGHAADADENAARVIAMKGAWLTQLPKKNWATMPDELKFEAYLKEAARRRV